MKFTLKNAKRFGWKGVKGWSYNWKRQFPRASVAFFQVNGRHGKVKTLTCDRIYYILRGKGKFWIKNKKYSVKKSDVIIIPQKTPYDWEGKMDLLFINFPDADPKKEVKLE